MVVSDAVGPAADEVVALAAVYPVLAAAPLDPVVALLAKDLVAAVPALQGVLAPAADTLSFLASA